MRPTFPVVMLYLGSRGPDVQRVQEALSARGLFKGEINGLFGMDTERAVQEFQRMTGLRVDGSVGPDVRAALFRDEKLEADAQAAIHGSAQATATPGGVGVGGLGAAPGGQLAAEPLPSEPNSYKPLLIVGALVLGGLLLASAVEPKAAFGDFEDDNGLPPMLPDSDDDDDFADDVAPAANAGAVISDIPSLDATPTDIVPFGGGAPLARGAGGKFLPRGA